MDVKLRMPGEANSPAIDYAALKKTSRNGGVEPSEPVLLKAGEQEEQRDVLRDVLKRTGELLSIGDRGLKFEMIEDADIYQLQVIDMTDGRVVRKIPPDEVVKVIAHLKEQLSERVDVFA
ncbi:MAG: flagellar protein FlaG [Synergistaceae bacterium]|nr:flagellar protein FlaG [Synergistaceae bacterium]